MNVGLSIASKPGEDAWGSSLGQSIGFLADLLARVPFVSKVFLIDCGEASPQPPWPGVAPFPAVTVRPDEVTHAIDLVIDVGETLPVEWLRHVRALGARIATLFVGHPYAEQAGSQIPGVARAPAFKCSPRDEIWTWPHLMKTSGPMLSTIGRAPVHAVPPVWSPSFLHVQTARFSSSGQRFAARHRLGQPWRVAIFEPNDLAVKTSFIPMLVCEQAYRRQPGALGFMMVANSNFMARHVTFNRFLASLDITRDKKASYERATSFAECMAPLRMDAVVAHQWECEFDPMYCEVLQGGYPLVHNSPMLRDAGAGLYYRDFDAHHGAQVLLDAWNGEPGFWDHYADSAHRFVDALAPDAPANIESYARRIDALVKGAP